MFWAFLCSVQVSFQVQVGPKMGGFGGKKQPKWQDAVLSKKPTWKLDNGPKHTPSNMERCFGHFYAPLRCHSRSRWVHKWVVLGVKNSQNDRMPYWAKKSTWKLENGSKHTPSNGERCVGHFYAPSRCHSRSRLVQKWVFLGLKNSQNKQYEVPKSENLSIVWRHLSKSLVPFFFQKLIYRTPLWWSVAVSGTTRPQVDH